MVTPPTVQPTAAQTLQQKADSSAAWLAANRPDLVSRPSVSAEEAARINQAYMQNTLPVLPKYAAPPAGSPGTDSDLTRVYIGGDANTQGTPMDLTRSEYIARFGRTPEASEAAKHMEQFHPAEYFGTSMEKLQGMTLGQIASRYGSRVADYVQDYSREHPSARFQEITQAYEAQQQRTVGSGGTYVQQSSISAKNPFDPNSAAGIAWEVERTGGTVGKTLGAKSLAEGYNPLVNFSAIERSTVPTRLIGSGMVAGMPETTEMQAGTVPVFMAVGGYQGVEIPNAKLAIDYNTGEFGVYAKPAGRSTYNLIGGGGRAAAQSGMFSVGESLWSPERTFQLGDIGRMEPVSREYQATHSKAGAEAYGGYSTVLTGKLLSPDSKMSTYESEANLARYVNPQGANLGKAAAPGAKIPSSLPEGAPVAQYMDKTGLLGIPIGIPTGEGRLVGGKTVAGTATVTGVGEPKVTTTTEKPSGDIFGANIPILSGIVEFFSPEQKVETRIAKTGEGTVSTTPMAGTSGYDRLNQMVRETLNLPSPEVGEKMTAVAEWSNPFLTPYKIEEVITGKPSVGRELLGFKGQYTQFYEQPLLSGLSYGGGALLGTAAKGIEIGYMGTRAAAAERIISTGGKYRAAEQFGATVMSRAPQVLTALYGAGIGIRATKGGTEITPEAAGRGRAIVTQEAYPMMLGFEAPGQVIKGVRTGQQAIAAAKQAIAEERTMAQRGLEVTTKAPGYEIRKMGPGEAPDYTKLPAVEDNMFVMGAASDIGASRYIAVKPTGEIVGAASYTISGEAGKPATMIAKYVGSMEPGVGTSLVQSMKAEAAARGVKTITGESRTGAVGFWEKMGAKVSPAETGARPFEIGVPPGYTKPVSYAAKATSREPVRASDVSLEDALRYMYEPKVRAATSKVLDVLSGDIAGTTISPMRVSAKTPSITERVAAAKKGISTYFDRPYPSEIQRSYYPYSGIEAKAYPKTGVSAADVIRGAKAKGMDLFDIPYQMAATARRTPITPEISRPLYPEYSTAGVYQKTTFSEKTGTAADILYGLKAKSEKILPPSTYGETKPLYGLYRVPGAEPGKSTTGGKPSGGGTRGQQKPAPEPSRFRETTVGGRKRIGLAKEPSLKDAGKATGVTEAAKRVYGKRLGEPSRRMKPMDTSKTKQAPAAVQIMREPLPKVEGMPEGARAAGKPRNIYLAPSVQVQQQPKTKVVSVTEPSLEFRQEERTASILSGLAGITPVSAARQLPAQERRTAPMMGIQESVWQGTILGTTQRIATEEAQRKDTRLTTLPALEFRTGLEESTRQEEKQIIGTSIWQDLGSKTTQAQTQVPIGFEVMRKVPVPPIPPEYPKFGLPGLPLGGGGGGGGYRKGSRAYVEVLGFEYSKRFNPFAGRKIPKKKIRGVK